MVLQLKSGKSYTALACIVKMAQRYNDNIGVFIVCPYIHLVSQWEEDVLEWCPAPIIAHSKSTTKNWKEKLKKAVSRYKRTGKPFVCITTNDTFSSDVIQDEIVKFDSSSHIMIVVDEAHNFGAQYLSNTLPCNVMDRIALSATIERYMDKSGTKALFDYFGDECIHYDLEQSIADGALVHYEYYPIPVYLDEQELVQYNKLTNELRKHLKEVNGKIKISESGKQFAFKRTALLAGAKQKKDVLMQLIEPYKDKKNILVYCGATRMHEENTNEEIRQIDFITNSLRETYGMSVTRFTSEESLQDRQNIKKYFALGQYQAVTAIRCLDEGVNIPGIETAFILSSSRNPKEFVQRRGRLLRKSEGKKKAYIYDFITLPRPLEDVMPDDFESDKSILIGEVARMIEFGRLADNEGDTEHMKNEIMLAYGVFFDAEEEVKRMEEYYGE